MNQFKDLKGMEHKILKLKLPFRAIGFSCCSELMAYYATNNHNAATVAKDSISCDRNTNLVSMERRLSSYLHL